MKTIFKILMMSALAVSAASCITKEYITEEYNTIVQGSKIQNIEINVSQDKWSFVDIDGSNMNTYFMASVNMPEITRDVFKKGLIKMYRCYDMNNPSAAVQVEMPFTRPCEECINGQWYYYTETVDYEFYEGGIDIYFTRSDFAYELDAQIIPSAMTFRCCIVY